MNKVRNVLKEYVGTLVAIAVLCVLLSITTEGLFISSNNLSSLLNLFTTNCILAFGATCVLLVGEIDFAVGSTVALSGVMLCIMMNQGVPFGMALIVVLLMCGFLGFAIGGVVVKTGMPSFIVTLAAQMIIRGAAQIICGGNRISSSNEALYQLTKFKLVGIPLTAIITVIICIALTLLTAKTVFGAHMYATGGNRNAALYAGVKIKRIIVVSMIMSEVLAGFAGILVASRVSSGQPTAGQGYEGNAIAAAVLGGVAFTGGRGTMVGALIGAFLIGTLNNGMNLMEIDTYWQSVCKGIIILFAVYIDTVKKQKAEA